MVWWVTTQIYRNDVFDFNTFVPSVKVDVRNYFDEKIVADIIMVKIRIIFTYTRFSLGSDDFKTTII